MNNNDGLVSSIVALSDILSVKQFSLFETLLGNNSPEMKQIENVEYLFERFLRIQGAVSTMQAELQDLKSIFKLYFEQGGQPIVATTGESLVYHHKQGFNYDFSLIKDTLEEIGALEKAVKLNSGFIDRLVNGRGLDEETKEKLRSARIEISTTKNLQVVKPDKHSQNN